MPSLLQETSKITGQHQTTVPNSVCALLDLKEGDQIRYIVAGGRVYIEPANAETLVPAEVPDEADPALGAFLSLIEADIKSHPERLQPLDKSLYDRINMLVGDMDVDIDAPLPPEDN